jgi:hypothetical protein
MIEDSSDLYLYYSTIKGTLHELLQNIDIGPDKTRVALGTFGLWQGTKLWDLDRYKTITSSNLINLLFFLYIIFSRVGVIVNPRKVIIWLGGQERCVYQCMNITVREYEPLMEPILFRYICIYCIFLMRINEFCFCE